MCYDSLHIVAKLIRTMFENEGYTLTYINYNSIPQVKGLAGVIGILRY